MASLPIAPPPAAGESAAGGAERRPVPGKGLVTLLAIAAVSLLVALACAGAGTVAAYSYLVRDLPTGKLLGTVLVRGSTKIFDRNGGLLFEALDPEGSRRVVVKAEQIPLVLKQATIATEDPSFYSNWGVDPRAVARAIYYNWMYGRVVSGGSTITQQLVKNGLLTPEQTVERKVIEAVYAIEMTRRFSKEQILAAYLNTVYYGNRSYGIQAAATSYFNKDVSALNLAEASLLAGLPQAPSLYDPCQDPEAALERQAVVLGLMTKAGSIGEVQARDAAREMTERLASPEFARRCDAGVKVTVRTPHFVQWVQTQLEQRYGPEVMYKGGLHVTTTLDPAVQSIAEDEARKQIAALRGKDASNTALVAMRPATGEIVAMVGSADYANKEIAGQVNVAVRPRQPGSAIKPINYVTAFGRGWTPATPIYDLRTEFPDGNRPPYVPVDYDRKERGLVTARFALANSLNIPAVKALYFTSAHDRWSTGAPVAMVNTARNLGITTFDGADGKPLPFGLALTLGAGEVTLAELTGAYAAFANAGARMPVTPFLKITDADGRVVFDLAGKDKPKPICARFDPSAAMEQPDATGACPRSAPYAYLITHILADNQTRTAIFGANNPLALSRPAAVKTGTTDSFKDNWTLGYTPELVVGVWMGNSNNTPMQSVPGALGAAPIWHNVMERVLNDAWKIPPHEFAVPERIEQVEICIESGLLPTDTCPPDHRRKEIFVAGSEPKSTDSVWVRAGCAENDRNTAIAMQPVHDVGDLIPYDQILAWARRSGWRLADDVESHCVSEPASAPKGNPGGGDNKKRDDDKKRGQGKGKGKR